MEEEFIAGTLNGRLCRTQRREEWSSGGRLVVAVHHQNKRGGHTLGSDISSAKMKRRACESTDEHWEYHHDRSSRRSRHEQ
eukprot:1187372-Pyramimonas_sp.AAC.1